MNIFNDKKLLFGLFLFLSLAGILVVWKNLWNFNSPMTKYLAATQRDLTKAELGIDIGTTLSEAELKELDSDEDGLSDYDELYLYQTSIYLPDSDSDGKSDLEEIQSGGDPICAEGEICYNSNEDNTDFSEQVIPEASQGNSAGDLSSFSEETVSRILSGAASSNEIKELLSLQGVPEETLSQIPEEELQLFYLDLVNRYQEQLTR